MYIGIYVYVCSPGPQSPVHPRQVQTHGNMCVYIYIYIYIYTCVYLSIYLSLSLSIYIYIYTLLLSFFAQASNNDTA